MHRRARLPAAGETLENVRGDDCIVGLPGGRRHRRVFHRDGDVSLSGETARRAAGPILARVNWAGESAERIRTAVKLLTEAGDAERYIGEVARSFNRRGTRAADVRPRPLAPLLERSEEGQLLSELPVPPRVPSNALARLNAPRRLALEMAIHESTERCALTEELRDLEAAWREAEEIAAIADNLLMPPTVERFLRAAKDRRQESGK